MELIEPSVFVMLQPAAYKHNRFSFSETVNSHMKTLARSRTTSYQNLRPWDDPSLYELGRYLRWRTHSFLSLLLRI